MIFTKLRKAIESFENDTIVVASPERETTFVRYLTKDTGGYIFSQKKVLNTIDLYYNSKFESSKLDSEGQRKLFLNICKFRADVANMQTNIDVANYVFIPDDYDSIWPTWMIQKQFKVWARVNGFGTIINELGKDFSKYGTCVIKRVGKKMERVPLRSLINDQDVKSLKDAATKGGVVIEVHQYSEPEIKAFKDWKTGLDFRDGKKKTVYEMYSLVERKEIDEFNGNNTNDDTKVFSMSILTSEKGENNEIKNNLLYIQEIKENDFPYEECHWDKQDGRWLGIGEVENQIENQIARNLSANLRRRAMIWSAKHIFQSTDQAIKKNLVKDIRDGDVMEIAPNGNITQVDMQTRALADFNADDAMWEQNSNQKSFTFEVATGESLPSGTPFRLGVMLTNTVGSHFKLKKQNLGLFLEKAFFNQIIEIFKKELAGELLSISSSEEGIDNVMKALGKYYEWEMFKSDLLSGKTPSIEAIKQKVATEIMTRPYHFISQPKGFYDNCKYKMALEITGEGENTQQTIETLTNVFTSVASNPMVLQDPMMMRLLEMIVGKTGQNLKSILGPITPKQVPQMPNANVNPQTIRPVQPTVQQ